MTDLPARYKRLGKYAEGGFGKVVFCEDEQLRRKVAIKFLHDPDEIRRILDELRALLLMRSKHVVQVYDIIPPKGDVIGIVEEFIDGEDLWVSKFPRTSLENYLNVIWQVAVGIADIHAAGVIHRDIKPNNMKRDVEGIVKIFDFGLARNEGPKAVTKGFVGTMGFAAPELYDVGTVTFSKQIDTYAFGVTALFLAWGSLPKELKKQPPLPVPDELFSSFPLDVPAELRGLIFQCLKQDPSDRPDMAFVRDEIARYLLRDRHQALVVFNGKASYLNADRRVARVELPTIGRIAINYDGLRFWVEASDGEAYINNRLAVDGMELPGSCVVALGAAFRRPFERAFITFDVSNPEVVL
jgi:serine/threonine-protein kinase